MDNKKIAEREKIAEDIKRYLDSGGKITKIPPGISKENRGDGSADFMFEFSAKESKLKRKKR
jgi:hypothetical protein